MGLPRNVLDNVPGYVGLVTNPDRVVPPDPPDGSQINGRAAVDAAEAALIRAAKEAERAACAAVVAGIGRREKD